MRCVAHNERYRDAAGDWTDRPAYFDGANEAIIPAGGKDAITRVWVLWADLDHPDAHDALDELPVPPAIVIASGTPGTCTATGPWRCPSAARSRRPPTAAWPRTRHRHRCGHERRDDPALTRHYSFKSAPPTPVVLQRLQAELTTVYAARWPPTPHSPHLHPRLRGRRAGAVAIRCASWTPATTSASYRPIRGALTQDPLPAARGPQAQLSRL